ncbi:MAG: response regulator [Myxococcaceae bacterium]
MVPKVLVVDDNAELLSLLTQLIEQAGYQVIGASKGKQAVELAKEHKPELAVLDVLLPDMMGYHLAEALRRSAPKLPLIFVTGVFKGGRHALEARSKFAAAGYFEKPFEAHRLIEAIGKVVPAGQVKPAQASAEAAFDVELDVDVEGDEPLEAMELTGRIKVTGGGDLSAEIRGANLTAKAVSSSASAAPRAQASVGSAPAPAARVPISTPSPGGQKRGELRDNLPSLITAFYMSKETGELGVQRGKVKKIVYFEKGQPVFALSNLVSDRFGQFLVRTGKITKELVADAAAAATASQRRTGDVLIERGLLKETERMFYVGQQIKAIIYSLFGWEDGTYVLTFREKAAAESIKLDVHPASLIIRGVKKLYKPARLSRLLASSDKLIPSLQPAYPLNEIELERWEAELMPKADGTRTVEELIALAQRPESVVLGFFAAMVALNVLEQRP